VVQRGVKKQGSLSVALGTETKWKVGGQKRGTVPRDKVGLGAG